MKPPQQNVLHVRQIAAGYLDYPIVTASNRWIRITLLDDWDASPLVRDLCDAGYRAKQLGPEIKVTKRGLNWPDTSAPPEAGD